MDGKPRLTDGHSVGLTFFRKLILGIGFKDLAGGVEDSGVKFGRVDDAGLIPKTYDEHCGQFDGFDLKLGDDPAVGVFGLEDLGASGDKALGKANATGVDADGESELGDVVDKVVEMGIPESGKIEVGLAIEVLIEEGDGMKTGDAINTKIVVVFGDEIPQT